MRPFNSPVPFDERRTAHTEDVYDGRNPVRISLPGRKADLRYRFLLSGIIQIPLGDLYTLKGWMKVRPGVELAGLSDVGCQRENNEDRYSYWEPADDSAIPS